jgi:hypothetical protein
MLQVNLIFLNCGAGVKVYIRCSALSGISLFAPVRKSARITGIGLYGQASPVNELAGLGSDGNPSYVFAEV